MRLNFLDETEMTTHQLKVYNKIMKGPRGKFGGPFPALLRLPKAADLLQELGSWLRFESDLSPNLREIAILVAAHHWDCKIEWEAHVSIAKQEGINPKLIQAISQDIIPSEGLPEELAVLSFCEELQKNKFVDDKTYNRTIKNIGLIWTIELTIILGYYTLLSMILNIFEQPPKNLVLEE